MLLHSLLTIQLVATFASSRALTFKSSDDHQISWDLARLNNATSPESADKVNVTLYVMSRCPDAVLHTKGIVDKVNLEPGYIAELNHSDPLGVTCKHGRLECLGNAHQLCLYGHLPLPTFYATLSCMNFEQFPGDIGKVELTKRCAEASGVDWWESGVGQCIEGRRRPHLAAGGKNGRVNEDETPEDRDDTHLPLGKEGHQRFLRNVRKTQRTGITTSCTIEIASSLAQGGKRICVVDGGVWKGCDDGHTAADFVRVIETEWDSLRRKGGLA